MKQIDPINAMIELVREVWPPVYNIVIINPPQFTPITIDKMKESAWKSISMLPEERDIKIIGFRFGLQGHKYTLKECGEIFDIPYYDN